MLYSARNDPLHGTQRNNRYVGECYRLVEWLVLIPRHEQRTLNSSLISFYRPKDGKEDLGPHAYTTRKSSYTLHARVLGEFSISIRLASPYECGFA